jgi:hypothetical protein
MSQRAMEGASLRSLVVRAIPLMQEAQRQCPRTGPGAKPKIPDWVMGCLIMTATLKRKKRKAAQWRFLRAHRVSLQAWLGITDFPSRTTYYRRYRRAYRLLQTAVGLQGQTAVAEGLADPRTVAADKSLIAARGPKWHPSDRRKGRVPKGLSGVDRDSAWGYSKYDGFIQGYSYEVVVSAGKNGLVVPLLASADTASASEHHTFSDKIDQLPSQNRYVLVDAGYDNNAHGDAVEYDAQNRATGRRFVCPQNRRNTNRKARTNWPRSQRVLRQQARRARRAAFLKSPSGKTLYKRRSQTVEPFHDWFKSLFELETHVWHRGLENNRTQLMACLFTYQLLLRHNCRRGNHNGRIRWILDEL